MPWKAWIYPCRHAHSGGSPECRECGEAGIYDGLRGSVTDLMCAYARMYGLVPIGPHRVLADEAFADTTRTCCNCGGRGYIESGHDDSQHCPECNGCGKIFLIPREQVEALRNAILAAFPEA